jgi:alpha-glucosidase
MDFVPNHSSDEHEWFIKSVQNENKYADYYVWSNGRTDGINRYPPNNWVGLVHVTLWEVLH